MREHVEGRSLIRQYAGILGAVIILVGLLGLALGERSLGGLLNIDLAEDLVHLASGALLLYVGFGQRDDGLARSVVGGLGVVYLLVGVLGFIVPDLFGLLPHEYSVVDNLFHIVLGLANIAMAWVVGRGGMAQR